MASELPWMNDPAYRALADRRDEAKRKLDASYVPRPDYPRDFEERDARRLSPEVEKLYQEWKALDDELYERFLKFQPERRP